MSADVDLIRRTLENARDLMTGNEPPRGRHSGLALAALDRLAADRPAVQDLLDESRSVTWSPVPPTEAGMYLHWSGEKDDRPSLITVAIVKATGRSFTSGFPRTDCATLGGYWQPVRVPERGSAQKEGAK